MAVLVNTADERPFHGKAGASGPGLRQDHSQVHLKTDAEVERLPLAASALKALHCSAGEEAHVDAVSC